MPNTRRAEDAEDTGQVDASRGALAGHRKPQSLVLDSVTKRYGGVTAIKDVSLTVEAGKSLGVIGPNGAGKSTLLKTIAAVHRPTSGTLRLGEVDLTRLAPHKVAGAGIGMAHQVPRPFRGMTVTENVAIGAASAALPLRERTAWIDQVITTTGLGHRATTPAGELRLLDLKRLELARALSSDPSLILLDEVAAGLNGRDLDRIIELIAEIRGEGRGLLLVEHVEGVIASLVDRVIVIDWGEVIADGTPAEISADPRVRAVYLGDDGGKAGAGTTRTTPRLPEQAGDAVPAALRLDDVTAGYGDIVALRDTSVELRAGEVVAVFGANGAGKSTLVGVASGLVQPRAGKVEIDGTDVTQLSAHARNRLGLAHCPEGRRIFGELSVRQNLTVAASLGVGKAEMASRLESVYDVFPILADLGERAGSALSGGQQQMLAIGRAMMSRPRVLLCDEISLGLAPVAMDDLYAALARIRDEGVSILLVEQNVHRGLSLADRVYVLDRGQVSYSGDPAPLADEEALDRLYFGDQVSPTASSLPPTPGKEMPL
ncbi:ATP-binding cassette domain-containing protein [Nocardioides sp.]|uniref:ATP-binding cassette domain-containing protein n=1 Tax=Nocardioides sp. TaxID=35761 RepID=UPI0039E2BBB6